MVVVSSWQDAERVESKRFRRKSSLWPVWPQGRERAERTAGAFGTGARDAPSQSPAVLWIAGYRRLARPALMRRTTHMTGRMPHSGLGTLSS